MAINWAKVRQAMTQTPDYNTSLGGGDAYYNRPNYQGSAYRANQYNNMRNFGSRPNAGGGADYMSTIGTPSKAKTVAKSNPNAWANARAAMTSPAAYGDEEEGGIMEVIKEKGSNFVNDAKTMASDLTPNVNFRMPGIGGLAMGMADSISNNMRDHRYLDSIYGKGSPEKNMAFFRKANFDAGNNMGTNDMTTMSIGDTSRGSSMGQAMKYFNKAGISQRNLERFMDPNDKFYGSEAYLRSQAGGSGAEDFDIGMSFIKNAKASANLARDMAYAEQADAANRGVSGVGYESMGLAPDPENDLLYGEPGYGEPMQSGIDYDAMGLAPDPENDLLYGEPGFGGITPIRRDKPEPYNPYRDEDYGAPLRNIDPYEGIYESPLADTLYNEELVAASPNPRLRNNPAFMKPRDTVAIESMGGGMEAFDRRTPGLFEYLPFYSGLGDFNFSPELEEDDVLLGDGSIVNSRLDLYN
tara:strand:+ start:102 stop:1508 length:1407 start_codon:yes stop_codon:yes gene_type:complete